MTAKSQLNIRISPASRRKLDELAEDFGTITTAVEVAIALLYDREHIRPPETGDHS
ncbi:MAG: hypothetical protein KC519_11205 [Anaerolineae bacterium]|nr:hypothetical protein [Anaerolineae bacterium]